MMNKEKVINLTFLRCLKTNSEIGYLAATLLKYLAKYVQSA